MQRILTAVLLVPMFAGCAIFDSDVDFTSTKRAKPLEVPPDLIAPERDDRFALPEEDNPAAGSTTYSEYEKSRRSGARSQTGDVAVMPAIQSAARIERAGSQRWLVVQGKPDAVWIKLKAFWEAAGYPLSLELPAIGIMETDWHEERARFSAGTLRNLMSRVADIFYSKPERNKYRTRLEAGEVPGTTEVYISHRQMYEMFVNEGQTDTLWQPQPANPELEAEMLRRFVVFTGVEENQARTMLPTPTPGNERSRLLEQADGPILEMDERFDRAWRRVGLALDRIGFTVEDRNRAEGVFYVRYVDSDAAALRKDGEGFFSWLAFWRSKPAPLPTQFSVLVQDAEARSNVVVRPRAGDVEDRETARKILGLLHEQLK